MARPTAEQVAQRAFDLGLLTELQLQEVWGSFGSRAVPVDDFLQTLVRRELMTNYQVERLVKGERSGFFFGDYKVLYLVGTGTFARVYRAVHRQTGKVVAVKVLRKRFSDNPEQFGLFIREGELGCTLRHPNIVPVYEVYSQQTTHFLVLEFVEGRNLREFVKIRKKLHPPEATRLMIDIVGGLQYAFERGLTHRDLRMSNVLVSSRGQAKLVDFGLAGIDENMAEESLQIDLPSTRTIDYAALERASGVRNNDLRSDIYFAGCIYYHMLTGQPPLLETKDRIQRLSKNRFSNVTPIQKIAPDLPHPVLIVINKSMSLDPIRRYQSPGEMLAELGSVARRLIDEPGAANETAEQAAERQRLASMLSGARPQHSVMVVEANSKMQDIFRDALKKAGFRVLLTSDPQRAFDRVRQDAKTIDCIVFNAHGLGESALETFNRMAADQLTQAFPALLLLEPKQESWKEKAKTGNRRAVLTMPLTMGELRKTLERLIPSDDRASAGAAGGRP
jgi:serine/threonine-protein kinase